MKGSAFTSLGAVGIGLAFPAGVFAPGAAAQSLPRADHVVLISVDGLRPEFYLDERWPAPTLQRMAREGAHARQVRTVFPLVTYPSHTTMVTGALPERHGIFYNTPFEPRGQTGRWYWDEAEIRVPTLWDAVRRAGRRSAAVSWPVTVGAPIDWNVPEVWSLERPEESVAVVRRASTPGLVDELERGTTGPLTSESWIGDHMMRQEVAHVRTVAQRLRTANPRVVVGGDFNAEPGSAWA